MLTPKFEISQSDFFVFLKIHAPYTSVAAAELTVENKEISFYAKPYLLRLTFPSEVDEEGSSCEYNADNGHYFVHIKKTNKGEVFPSLDLLTTLLHKKNSTTVKPLIEVVSNNVEFPDLNKKVHITWDDDHCKSLSGLYGFGFANKLHNIDILETFQEVIALKYPDKFSLLERHAMRLKSETSKFDSDHYLADLYEDDIIQEVIEFKPWWDVHDLIVSFSSSENALLQRLPNKEYLLSDFERKLVFLGLVDILFGFVYNVRETEGDGSIESSWTIRTISSTLSWCATSLSLHDVVITSYRRLISYPQHRNWKLANQIKRDVIKILKLGQRCVLKCFLQIFSDFRDADGSPCYILNDLYITDYCVWIQKQPDFDEHCSSLANALDEVFLSKPEVDLELDLLEEAARFVVEETAVEPQLPSDSVHEELVTNMISLTL